MGLPHLPLRQAHFLLYWKGFSPLGRWMFLVVKRISRCCAPAFFSLRKGWAGQQSPAFFSLRKGWAGQLSPAFACVLVEFCGSQTGMSECLQKDGAIPVARCSPVGSVLRLLVQRAAIVHAVYCNLRTKPWYVHPKPLDGHPKAAYVHPKAANGDFTSILIRVFVVLGRIMRCGEMIVLCFPSLFRVALQRTCAASPFHSHKAPMRPAAGCRRALGIVGME